ncbi:MAG: hypothetical protein ACRCXM_14270 [Beijerinckiaceae bacterium]
MATSLFDFINDGMQNPLFLGGANLAMGGGPQGMMQGMQAGAGFQRMRREDRERDERSRGYASLFADPAMMKQLGPMAPLLRTMGPEMGLPMAGQYVMRHPELEMARGKTAAETRYLDAGSELRRARARGLGLRTMSPTGPSEEEIAAQKRQAILGRYTRDSDGNIQRAPSLDEEDQVSPVAPAATVPQSRPSGARNMSRPLGMMRLGGPGPNAYSVGSPEAGSMPGVTRVNSPGAPAPKARPQQVRDNTFSDEEIQEYYDAKFPGARDKGHIWRRDGTLQNLKQTQSERQGLTLAQDGIAAVRNARGLLGSQNGLQEALGFGIEVPGLGRVRLGTSLNKGIEDASIAHREMGTAMHEVLKMMSGATVSNAERASYVDMYMPSAGDTARERTFKLDRIEKFFQRMVQSHKTGATQEDIGRLVREEMDQGRQGQPQQRSEGRGSSSPQSRRVYDPSTGSFREVRQ